MQSGPQVDSHKSTDHQLKAGDQLVVRPRTQRHSASSHKYTYFERMCEYRECSKCIASTITVSSSRQQWQAVCSRNNKLTRKGTKSERNNNTCGALTLICLQGRERKGTNHHMHCSNAQQNQASDSPLVHHFPQHEPT